MSTSSPLSPRWRFRFSLRTLLLAALLCGSAMLLWRNRAPWQVWKTITETAPISRAEFSPQGTYFYTRTLAKTDEHALVSEVIHIYETETGRLQTTVKSAYELESEPGSTYFSAGEHYIIRVASSSGQGHTTGVAGATCEMWQVADGARFGTRFFPWNSSGAKSWPEQFSSHDSFALIGSDKSILTLYRLPTFEQLRELPLLDSYEHGFVISPDEKWLAYADPERQGSLVLVPTQRAATERRFYPNGPFQFEFSPDSRALATAWPLTTSRPADEQTWLIDVQTGATKFIFDGGITRGCFSDDGRHLATLDNPKNEAIIWDLATNKECLRFKVAADARVRIVGDRVFSHDPLECYDLPTGARLWKRETSGGQVTADGAYVVNNPYLYYAGNAWPSRLNIEYLIDATTGQIAHQFELPPNDPAAQYFHWAFAAKQKCMLSVFETLDVNTADPRNFHLQLWHRRRPEQWWGYAWLWEFWLLLAFVGALVWSVFRSEYSLRAVPLSA